MGAIYQSLWCTGKIGCSRVRNSIYTTITLNTFQFRRRVDLHRDITPILLNLISVPFVFSCLRPVSSTSSGFYAPPPPPPKTPIKLLQRRRFFNASLFDPIIFRELLNDFNSICINFFKDNYTVLLCVSSSIGNMYAVLFL